MNKLRVNNYELRIKSFMSSIRNLKFVIRNSNEGFTLIELMVVIIILATLAALLSGNFLNSLKKGRDAKRKADLQQVQVALESFYEDKRVYPSTDEITFGSPFCETSSCVSGEKKYMVRVPVDPQNAGGFKYTYCTDATKSSYQLYTQLENTQDSTLITPAPLANCTSGTTCISQSTCNWGLASSNVNP